MEFPSSSHKQRCDNIEEELVKTTLPLFLINHDAAECRLRLAHEHDRGSGQTAGSDPDGPEHARSQTKGQHLGTH